MIFLRICISHRYGRDETITTVFFRLYRNADEVIFVHLGINSIRIAAGCYHVIGMQETHFFTTLWRTATLHYFFHDSDRIMLIMCTNANIPVLAIRRDMFSQKNLYAIIDFVPYV